MAARKERTIHESTSRSLCRAAFLLMGAVPIFCCLAFCLVAQTPWYDQWQISRWESRLQRSLGLGVNIGFVETLSPHRARLSGVRFRHRELSIATAQSVVVERQDNHWYILANELSVEGPKALSGWQAIHDAFLCNPKLADTNATCRIQRLLVRGVNHGAADHFAMDGVELISSSRGDTTQLTARFVPSPGRPIDPQDRGDGASNEATPTQPVQLAVRRLHQAEKPATEIQIQAGTPVPISLINLVWGGFRPMGPAARLRGSLFIRTQDSGWTAEVGSRTNIAGKHTQPDGLEFLDVDFGQLYGEAPSDVAAFGSMFIRQGLFTAQGVQSISGQIQLGPGKIRSDFLRSAAQQLQIAVAQSSLQAEIIDFGQAIMVFDIDTANQAIRLAAQMLSPNGTPTALREDNGPVPLENLVATFRNDVPIPISAAGVDPISQSGSDPTHAATANRPTHLAALLSRWFPTKN